MAQPLKLGIVGAGTMGRRTLARIRGGELADFTVGGICDVDEGRAHAVGAEYDCRAFGSLERLLDSKPDALYIATPDDSHLNACVMSAQASVAFLVEKPLATTVQDAEEIARAVSESGVAAEVNFSNRWNPPFVSAKHEIESGELGEFVTLFARLNNSVGSPRERLAWSSRTTSAWFLLSHCFDLAFWLHGRQAESVYASGVRGLLDSMGVATWDSIHAIVRYVGDVDGAFESVWVLPDSMPSPVEFTFRYVGSRGAATMDTHEQNIRVASDERIHFPATLNWAPARFASFAATVRGEQPPQVPVGDGVENTKILVALHRSLESGCVEKI